jgi:hypothetical protein
MTDKHLPVKIRTVALTNFADATIHALAIIESILCSEEATVAEWIAIETRFVRVRDDLEMTYTWRIKGSQLEAVLKNPGVEYSFVRVWGKKAESYDLASIKILESVISLENENKNPAGGWKIMPHN